MKIEFKVYELTESFGTVEYDMDNEFVKVGADNEQGEEYYLLLGVNAGGLTLIPGLNIQDNAYKVPKDLVKLKGNGLYSDWYEFDIPLEYLDLKIIQDIQNLNCE